MRYLLFSLLLLSTSCNKMEYRANECLHLIDMAHSKGVMVDTNTFFAACMEGRM